MDKDFANIEGMFKTNTDIVKKAIVEVPPEHWFVRPGDDSNHLMWVTGHLIWSRGNVIKSLNISQIPVTQKGMVIGKISEVEWQPAIGLT